MKACLPDCMRRLGETAKQALSHILERSCSDEMMWWPDAWLNISRCGQFNLLHDHGSYTWSAVYYVSAGAAPREGREQDGNICFRTTIVGGLCQYMTCRPKPGSLIIFPGWLPHCVCPNSAIDLQGEDEAPRISVAFNFNFGTREAFDNQSHFDVRPKPVKRVAEDD